MPKEPKRRNHSADQSLKCQRVNRAMEKLEQMTESSARGRNNLHFNDMNVDCIEHIFSFLTIKDKLNFSQVCSAWKAMCKKVWRIVDLNVIVDRTQPSSKEEKLEVADLNKLLEISGLHLKSLDIYVHYAQAISVRGRINAEEYVLIEQFNLCDFLKVIANICTDIQNFVCNIRGFGGLDSSQDISSFVAAISKLISRNGKMKCFKLNIEGPLFEYFELKDLPESIEDFEINFFVEDVPAICDWLSVAKNLRSLSFHAKNSFDDTPEEDITSQIIKCVTYDYAINIKVLQLNVPKSPTVVHDMQHIAFMKSLEELKIDFSNRNVQIDDFLSAISFGCKNLKKLDLCSCTFTCKGMNSISSELDLTHLRIATVCLQLNTIQVPQTTLQSLRLCELNVDSSSLTKLLETFKELQFIEIYRVRMTEEHIYDLCAACPRLEHVDLSHFSSEITDQAIHHLLTTLPNLTSAKLFVRGTENIIPLHVNKVNSNIRNLTWGALEEKYNLVQLTKLHNMRSLTIEWSQRHLKQAEMEAICYGSEKLEEIHFQQPSYWPDLNEKDLEEELKSLLLTKPSLRLATITNEPMSTGRIGETITLKKQHGIIVKSTKMYSTCV